MAARPVILFDGVCHLCNGFVRFVLARDGGRFDFAPLQSAFAQQKLRGRAWDSVALAEGGELYFAEEAALRILAGLRAPWPWLARAFRVLPKPLLAWGYRLIARHRYRIFGREEQCALPRPEWQGRFLS